MYCINCGTENSADSLFCKKCGYSLVESYLSSKSNNNYSKVTDKNQIVKKVNKNYNKKTVVNKVKKIQNKDKSKKNKDKNKYIKEVKIVRKMSGFQKFMFFLLILVVLTLIGVVGLLFSYIVKDKTNIVPNVIGMNYEEAENILENLDFNVSKKIIEGKEGIVLKQSKNSGDRTLVGSNIVLTVGKSSVVIPNLVGMSKDGAVEILNQYGIKYEIKNIEGRDDIVLYQSPSSGTKVNDIDKVILKIGIKSDKSVETEENLNPESEIKKNNIQEDSF